MFLMVRLVIEQEGVLDATSWTDNDVVVAVVDMDNGAVYFARNNTYINSGVPTSGS